jgi:amino acid adenylation domain-containing protein
MPIPVSTGYELSSQQRLLVATGHEKSAAAIAVLLQGELDRKKLRNSLEQLVQRHEILRTTFQRRTGMKFPFQVVGEQIALGWEDLDLTGISPPEQDAIVKRFLLDSSKIDIENGPVFHARLLTLGPRRAALALTISALCVDDHSLNQLLSEIAAIYGDQKLSNDVLQYADYSEWHGEVLSTKDEQAQQAEQFWSQTGFETMPALAIPFERKHPHTGSWNLAAEPVKLRGSANLSAEFLFAAWQAFLGRITGRQEFVIGYLSDGRNHDEFRSGIGPFTRPLPISTDSDPDWTFGHGTNRARDAVSAALELEDFFAADRLAGRDTIGFSCFRPIEKVPTSGVQFSEISRHVPATTFRLQLRCAISHGVVQPTVEYDTRVFAPETIAQLAERFAIFAGAAKVNPETQVSRLLIMGEDERRKVSFEFNRTTADYPKDKCIHQLFESQAARNPGRLALRFGECELHYAELNGEANRIAHVLLKNGTRAGVPVALCLERSAEMISALLGILKAGGCYVPLVPDNPKARLAHQLAETGAPVVLTEEKHIPNLPEFAGKTICLDRDHAMFDAAADSNPNVQMAAEDLAYVIYTSGSTGVPKGVAVRHFNLVNYSHFISRKLKLDEHPAGLHFATVSTISADLGNTCIFPSLISGGCLHVIGYETAMSPVLFSEYVTHHPIDVLKITPSHLSSLLDGGQDNSVLPRKYLVLGGEATRWDLVERIRKARGCALLNHYGPTEATVGCCTFDADTDVESWEPATLPIGKPIDNDEIYILDSHMEPVPIGVAGELCIGGAGLAQGYLNQPSQTAERFVRNPFSQDSNSRLYRTGDLARFLPDGNIEFLGRIDAQVKIRGFRVEPAEIEAVLKKHPEVATVAIVSYETDPGEKKLAAYVVARTQTRADDLRAFLLQQLPDYMVPSAFIFVESLPLTANGKLDLRALPAPEAQPVVRESIGPRNEDEQKLTAIWHEVLKRDVVGVTDNFFELGGHSLLATQIISRVRNTFRVQLPLHSFLQNPTIAALAEQLKQYPAIESEQEELARLLQELDGISDEEAGRLLSTEAQKHGKASGG